MPYQSTDAYKPQQGRTCSFFLKVLSQYENIVHFLFSEYNLILIITTVLRRAMLQMNTNPPLSFLN